MFSDQNSHSEPEDNLLNRPLADYYLILISAILLLGLGVMMVLSASSPYAGGNPEIRSPYAFAIRQTIFLAAGGVVGWVISRIQPKSLARFGRLAITLAALLLLTIALLALSSSSAAIGDRGNTNWLGISKQLAIQPSEFAKLALVLWASATFAERVRKLDRPEKLIIPFVPVSAILIGLVLAGKDLGTAMILGLIVLSLLWFVGTPMRILAGLAAVAGVVVGLLAMTSANRLTRIKVWLDPASDPDIAAQPISSMYALASGGWWGVGLGAGKQKWGGLRNGAHTDFIFSVIGEELGFVGVLVVLILFAILGFAGLRVALRSDHPLSRTLAAGITSWFIFQATINIMVVLNLLPVLGIPLPFISYGGSSLVANLMGLGMLLSCARNEPEARRVLAARRSRNKIPKQLKLKSARTGR